MKSFRRREEVSNFYQSKLHQSMICINDYFEMDNSYTTVKWNREAKSGMKSDRKRKGRENSR